MADHGKYLTDGNVLCRLLKIKAKRTGCDEKRVCPDTVAALNRRFAHLSIQWQAGVHKATHTDIISRKPNSKQKWLIQTSSSRSRYLSDLLPLGIRWTKTAYDTIQAHQATVSCLSSHSSRHGLVALSENPWLLSSVEAWLRVNVVNAMWDHPPQLELTSSSYWICPTGPLWLQQQEPSVCNLTEMRASWDVNHCRWRLVSPKYLNARLQRLAKGTSPLVVAAACARPGFSGSANGGICTCWRQQLCGTTPLLGRSRRWRPRLQHGSWKFLSRQLGVTNSLA